MKLQKVNTGHRLFAKMKLTVFGAVAGDRAPDVLRLLLYRPELFGRPFMQYVQSVLRGASSFTPGERELFAAYVSKLNRCAFCYGSHHAVAARALGEDLVDSALSDYRKAELRPELKGAMGFIEIITQSPASLSAVDVRRAKDAGLSVDDIEELVHLSAVFCTINSLADSLGFQVPAAESFARMAGPLLKHGYTV